ncbi:MAG TPA: type I-E CRISPR-associated protein Cse1/CasA [Alphaproteobacteria bacterium]|nr:type I-E CRISPR-associated protein Cse1/CasA [Alphaproteobacteria bacterium]
MWKSLSYLDQPIPVERRRTGAGWATPLDITAAYGDDPIVAVRLGHPLADRGFEFLMRDLLQAALAPEDIRSWAMLLRQPPAPVDLASCLAPYAEALDIVHPRHPALQVRPNPARRAAAERKPPGRGKPRVEADEDDDEPSGAMPIAGLLPDLPTGEAVKQNTDFFMKRGSVAAIGAGAILPVLYGHQVLFPPAGGGYFGMPHGADSIKFQLVGRTLWETLWLNVLPQDYDVLAQDGATWPAPATAAVLPWLDESLAEMPLGRNEAGAARPLERPALHPAHIPMPRRYLLAPPVEGRCGLTGREGPVFTAYERWPKGLQYQPRGWWHLAVSRIESEAPDPEEAPLFLRARGPLRFDDWLQTALLDDKAPAGPKGKVRRLPPVLRPLAVAMGKGLLNGLAEPGEGATAVARRLPFRVRATAQYLFGKAVGGMSQRELPVWLLERPEVQAGLIGAVSKLVGQIGEIAVALKLAAAEAAKLGNPEAKVGQPDDLYDALLAGIDHVVLALPGQLAGAAPDGPTDAADEIVQMALETARDAALALFDGTFPITGRDQRVEKLLVGARGRLVRRIAYVLKKS